jgi:hypothetical protein
MVWILGLETTICSKLALGTAARNIQMEHQHPPAGQATRASTTLNAIGEWSSAEDGQHEDASRLHGMGGIKGIEHVAVGDAVVGHR